MIAYDRLGIGRSDARRGTLPFVAGPCEVEILPGCHHVPHREAEEVIVERVARFLAPVGALATPEAS